MTRFVPVAVLAVIAVIALGSTRVARADMGMLPGRALTLSFTKLYINENGQGFVEPSDPDARRHYFNLAHCTCSKAGAGMETTFQYLLTLDMVTGTHRPAQVWVGVTCDDPTTRLTMCRQLTGSSIADIDSLIPSGTRVEASTFDVINGFDTTDPCVQREGDAALWISDGYDGHQHARLLEDPERRAGRHHRVRHRHAAAAAADRLRRPVERERDPPCRGTPPTDRPDRHRVLPGAVRQAGRHAGQDRWPVPALPAHRRRMRAGGRRSAARSRPTSRRRTRPTRPMRRRSPRRPTRSSPPIRCSCARRTRTRPRPAWTSRGSRTGPPTPSPSSPSICTATLRAPTSPARSRRSRSPTSGRTSTIAAARPRAGSACSPRPTAVTAR